MSHDCETVEIQTTPSTDNPSGIVVINKSDLTAEHKLVGAIEVKVETPVTPVKK